MFKVDAGRMPPHHPPPPSPLPSPLDGEQTRLENSPHLLCWLRSTGSLTNTRFRQFES